MQRHTRPVFEISTGLGSNETSKLLEYIASYCGGRGIYAANPA